MLVHCDVGSPGGGGAVASSRWFYQGERRRDLAAVLASVSRYWGVVMKSLQAMRGRRVGPSLRPLPGPRSLAMREEVAALGAY